MGKNDFLTPKAIASRIKAKGLQKLRWYCQMCQKQCGDENGFKCHCLSESHQRQMQVFGMNPNRVLDGCSEEFERTFLDHMRRSHRFSRVAAIVVYNEYISDRHHVHMNSTEWATLTEFVKYLGRTSKCKVEETPKGWFITYIDRNSETIFKDRLKNKRIRSDLAEEERQERAIAQQIERAVAGRPSTSDSVHEMWNPPQSEDLQPPPAKSLEKIVFSIQPILMSSSKPNSKRLQVQQQLELERRLITLKTFEASEAMFGSPVAFSCRCKQRSRRRRSGGTEGAGSSQMTRNFCIAR